MEAKASEVSAHTELLSKLITNLLLSNTLSYEQLTAGYADP
eukprot:COSAG01_NODE_6285_length_3753_cov_7.145047_4_plen_41_part_00